MLPRLRFIVTLLIVVLILPLPIASQPSVSAAAGGPIVLTTYPSDNDAAVPANAKLKLVFDEPVTRGAGRIEIKEVSTNNTVDSLDVAANTAQVQFANANTVVVTPTAGRVLANTDYYVVVSPNAFGGASAGYAGISDATAWNFRTVAADTTPPQTVGYAPAAGGTIAGTDALVLTFNERVNAAAGNIRIVRRDNMDTQVIPVLSPSVSGSGTVNADGRTEIRIQPPIRLNASQLYDVYVDAGAFVDQVGNAYGGIAGMGAWWFRTADKVVADPALSPANNAASVDPNVPSLTLTFAANMQKGSGKIYVKRVSDNAVVNTFDVAASPYVTVSGNVVTLSLVPRLAAGTAYYVQVEPGALLDAAGYAFDGYVDAVSWRFTTAAAADTTRPVVTALTPAAGGNTTALNSQLTMQFSKPVWPGSGAITIRNVSNNSVLCTLNVTSGSVTGGGTNTITITPCASFSLNQAYAVQIPSQAFVDQTGLNYYAGIPATDTTTWRFTAAQDTAIPELVGTSPAPQTNSVAQDAVLRLTFNEPVQVVPGYQGEAVLVVASGSGAAVKLALAVAGDDPKSVTLSPVTVDSVSGATVPAQFARASQYIVRVPEGAITDLAGNRYPGIMNAYRWTFNTIGSDTLAPTLQGTSMDGAAVVLTYNEDMDSRSLPYASNFYVTVNDVPRQVNAVTIDGPRVRLQLQSGVTVGQKVMVSYTLDASSLQDLSGNKAAAFRDVEVTNTVDTTVPRPTGGSVNGSVLTLTFSKTLAPAAAAAANQFGVKLGGSPVGINSVTLSGNTATFVLGGSASGSASASVSYTPGGYPLYDMSGNAVAAFADFYVRNQNDASAPQFVSGSVAGTQVTLVYNEGLDPAAVPLKSSFSIVADGQAVNVTSVAISNNTVVLTLAQAIAVNQHVLITYIPSTAGIQDLAGNRASVFSGYQVVAGGGSVVKFASAVTNGSSVVLNYSGALSGASIPNVYQYNVTAGGGNVAVNSVTVSGAQVTLQLAGTVLPTQQVTLSYTATGIPLKDANGTPVDTLSQVPVTFSTSGLGAALPDYLDLDGAGGMLYKVAAASAASGQLPSGSSAKQYTLDQQKTLDAFALWRTGAAGVTAPQLTFAVPSSEAGAVVAVPLQAVLQAQTMSPDAAVRVTYQGITFKLPLDAASADDLLRLAAGNVAGSYLVLKIEQSSNITLSSRISLQGAQLLATPVTFAVSVMTSGVESAIEGFDAYAAGSIVPTIPASSASTAVVRLDNASGELSYVPSGLGSGADASAVRLQMRTGGAYAVAARTPTVYGDMRNHWAASDVAALAAKFIVDGPTAQTFDPQTAITRADFARFIAKGLGLVGNRAYATSKFRDVTATTTGAAFIGAAVEAGIVQGDAAGTFRPNAPITREEMATMMQRAMTYAGTQPSPTGSELSRFGDGGQVSSWATEAVNASIRAGLMNGSTDGKFHPKANTTRAEAAVIVKRMLEYAELL